MRGRRQFWIAALALLGFAAITLAFRLGAFARLDLAAAQGVGRLRTPSGVAIASGLSDLATPLVVSAAIALALLLRRRRGDAPALIAAPLGAFLSSELLKLLIHRPRPAVAAVTLPHGFAFPSGHATAAAATYLTIALVLSHGRPAGRRAAWLAFATGLAIAVAASRVYLGVHYLSDVLAGLLWGTAWALWATWRGTGAEPFE
ncbi:MAG: hypothetical protein DMD37_08525 [Gemmatimonadetes bacterium]|nr:MAG: hypothetical protein DMD74_04885 [Gemmatimonadota bacterium]PYO82031.1 MAG: hypothetical protein DMD68_12335 [Gemmatimonadota bacterium]PYP62816.1 MAG: hypothetical protein DMD37_08525 [Gemmatimonadota bacterium]